MKLSVTMKAEYRKILLDNGIRPRGMSDQEISDKVAEIKAGNKPEESPRSKPTKPQAPVPFKQPEGLPAQDSKPEAKPEPAPQAPAPDAAKIAGSIEQIIKDALNQPQAIDEAAIIALIQKHSLAPTRIEYEVNITRQDGGQKKIAKAHSILGKVLDLASIGENVFLSGPAACGKTTLGEQCADALGYSFHFTGSVADKYEMTGFIDANGTFHESSFYKALTYAERGETGAVFMFDEVDASVPVALVAVNAALENGYFNFPNKRVTFDKNKVFFLACANTMGKGANRSYTGRYPLDDATLNRFWRGYMGYDLSIEISMAESAWLDAGGLEDQKQVAIDFCHEVVAFRRQLDDKGIMALITPRHTRRGAGLLAKGWKLADVRQELYVDLNVDQCKTLGVNKTDG